MLSYEQSRHHSSMTVVYIGPRVNKQFVVPDMGCAYVIVLQGDVSSFYRCTVKHPRGYQIELDGHGRARREAARRRKSECKINFRKTKFLSQ